MRSANDRAHNINLINYQIHFDNFTGETIDLVFF